MAMLRTGNLGHVDDAQHPPLIPPPPLRPRLVDLTPIVLGGTALWFGVFLVALAGKLWLHVDQPILLWTAFCGWILGLLGYSITRWQRSAARQGRRGAQRVV
jgi:hypothetical protein